MIYRNAHVILADEIRDDLEVVCDAGRVTAVRFRSDAPEAIDCGGNYLAPGFIDLHVHGGAGHDSMDASPAAFRAISDFHASGGTTSLLLTTATAGFDEIVDTLAAVRDYQKQDERILGAHVEGPFLSPHRAGAQCTSALRVPDGRSIERLLEFADTIRRITVAPELPGAPEAVAAFSARGISVSGGHSDAWDEEAAEGFRQGMRHVTHTFNCMSSARRRDGVRVAGLLEYALSEPAIFCELIADGHHVSPTLMRMLYHAKTARGICLVTDATAGAGLADGSEFKLAGAACVVRSGACYLRDEKVVLAGSASRMIDLVRVMVNEVRVPLCEAVAMASTTPARTLHATSKGAIAPGSDADLILISPELELIRTYVAGDVCFPR